MLALSGVYEGSEDTATENRSNIAVFDGTPIYASSPANNTLYGQKLESLAYIVCRW